AHEPYVTYHINSLSEPHTLEAQKVSATVAPHVPGRLLEHHGAEAAPHVAATQPSLGPPQGVSAQRTGLPVQSAREHAAQLGAEGRQHHELDTQDRGDRKSTRLNSSHVST